MYSKLASNFLFLSASWQTKSSHFALSAANSESSSSSSSGDVTVASESDRLLLDPLFCTDLTVSWWAESSSSSFWKNKQTHKYIPRRIQKYLAIGTQLEVSKFINITHICISGYKILQTEYFISPSERSKYAQRATQESLLKLCLSRFFLQINGKYNSFKWVSPPTLSSGD